MMSLQSIIWVILLNNFSRVINLLLTKLARDRTGRISAALGPYCQELGPIFSQYGPRAWSIRYIYSAQLTFEYDQMRVTSKIPKLLIPILLTIIFFKWTNPPRSHNGVSGMGFLQNKKFQAVEKCI